MFRDPIVEEVRAARQRHAAQFGYDLRKIAEDLRKKRDELPGWRVVSFRAKRPVKP